MALPGDLATCVITGSFADPAGLPLHGRVYFTPSVILSDPGDSLVIPQVTSEAELSGGSFSITLLGTDASQIVPQGWAYDIRVELQNTAPYCFTAYLPSADSPLDISELTPLEPVTQMGAYLLTSGGTMLGPLYAAEPPSAELQVATKGYVDGVTAGLAAKGAVLVATATALPANTAPGGLTLTANMTGSLIVDGVTVALEDRVLVKNESAAQNNGIYCLTTDTEILTTQGWKLPGQLHGNETVLTVNVQTELAEWQPLGAVHVFDVSDEPMLALEGPAHSSLSTMDHRWVVQNHWAGSLKIQRSRNLGISSAILRSAPCSTLPTEPKYSDALVELVAWFITEGHIRPLNTGRPGRNVRIAQSEKVNAPYVARIRAALTEVFGPAASELGRYRREPRWTERRNSNGHGLTMFDLNAVAGPVLIEHAPDRVARPGFIASLTRAQLALFVDTCIAADGACFTAGSTRGISQKDARRLDAIEMAAILLGFNVNRLRMRADGMTSLNIGHARRFVEPLAGNAGRRSRYSHQVRSYTGQVWCPETSNGTWLARRRGTVYFTGNTVTAPGSSMTPWVLTRTSDMDTSVQVPGAYTFVQEGTANAGFGFIVSGVGPYVVGTTAITWEQFTSTGDLMAGTGLSLSGDTVSLNVPVTIPDGGTGAITAAGALAALGANAAYSEKPTTADATYYVSADTSASDSNDGLSPGSAKATIAAAIAAIGTTTGAYGTYNNNGLIILGPGQFTDATAHVITGTGGTAFSSNYPSFEIRGAGRDLTFIQGPDAAAWIQFVNCQRTMVRDLTYSGSPSATGWGIEYNASWNMGGQYWYGSDHGSTGNQLSEVCFGCGVSPACAYGVRFTIANLDSDGNNDEGTFWNCRFYHCVTPVSVEHAESLQHRFIAPRFETCGEGFVFQGGSATIIAPVVGNFSDYAGTSGYFLDLQPAVGGTFNGGSTPAAYFHDIEVTNVQSETNAGWVRSNVSAVAAGSVTQLVVRFTGGNLIGNAANCPVPGMLVDWESNNSASSLTFSNLYFGASGTLQVNAPASNSRVTFSGCVMQMHAFNWAGTLAVNNCWNSTTPVYTGGVLKAAGLAQGTATSRPTAQVFGDGLWFSTDTGVLSSSNGGAWSAIAPAAPVAPTVVTLADASVVTVNASAGNEFLLQMTSGVGATRQLGNPSSPASGQMIMFHVTQDSSGSQLLTYGTAYLFSTSLPAPTLSIGAGYTDLLGFVYNQALGAWLFCAFVQGFA